MSATAARASAFLSGPYVRECFSITVILAAVTLLLHGSALNGYWRYDDGAHMQFALSFSPWQYFLVPEITRAQSGANVTPWNALFYDINLGLFGLEPRWHYAHLLALLWGGALALYAVLRQWLSVWSSGIGAVVFLLGVPTTHVAQLLMTAHYATGLLFSLLAVLAWIRALRGKGRGWRLCAVLAYLLAATCKEIYVPLVLLLPFLPVCTLRERLHALWPFVLVALAYAAWRYAVLGVFIGGYTAVEVIPVVGRIMQQLLNVWKFLTGDHTLGTLGLILIACMFFVAAWRRRINWPLILCGLIVFLAPLLPLVATTGLGAGRYFLVPWLAVAVITAAVLPHDRNPLVSILIGIGLLFALIAAQREGAAKLQGSLEQQDALYRFAVSIDGRSQALYVPHHDDYYRMVLSGMVMSVHILGKNRFHQPAVIASSLTDLIELLGRSELRIYQADGGAFRDVTDELKAGESDLRARFLAGDPQRLFVDLRYANNVLFWELGPYSDGTHELRLLREAGGLRRGGYTVSQKARYPWPHEQPLEFVYCFKATNGWISCTPTLRFEPKDIHFRWEGPAALPWTSGTTFSGTLPQDLSNYVKK